MSHSRSAVPKRALCEQKLRLDIRHMARCGGLDAGDHIWIWKTGEREREMMYQVAFNRRSIRIMYNDPRTDQKIRDVFRVEWLPCPYGGSRPWFRCKWCEGRCAIIYGLGPEGHFGCRRCLDLGYAVENEVPRDRAWRAYRKVMDKLGGSYYRPPNMRFRTYFSLVKRANRLYACALPGREVDDIAADL